MEKTITSDFMNNIKNNNGIFVLDSGINGNITTILTGIHGNEISGVIALEKILSTINVIKGKVNFIVGNIQALNENVRFIDVDMNGLFKEKISDYSLEGIRVKELIKYIEESNSLLDIHNTLYNGAVPFLITEHNERRELFNVDFTVKGFDNLHLGSSDRYMNIIGGKGYCLEAGYYGDNKSHMLAYDTIINFLKYEGHINDLYKQYKINKPILYDYKYITQTGNFKLSKNFEDFTLVNKGDIIGYENGLSIVSPYLGYILFAYEPENSGRIAFCLGRENIK